MEVCLSYLRRFLDNPRYFWRLILVLTLAKLALLIFSAHPFDFWAFVNTVERYFVFGWNPFELWNKGVFLVAYWQGAYALYAVVLELLNLAPQALPLLYGLFKLPYVLIDLGIAYLILMVVRDMTQNLRLARGMSLLWLMLPLPYMVYGLHGHYEILVPFALMLMLRGMQSRSWYMLAAGLVLGFTTKYFVIALAPFLLLYLIADRQGKGIVKTIGIAAVFLVLSYPQFFFDSSLISQTLRSIFDLGGSGGVSALTERVLSPLNLVSALNFFVDPSVPIVSTQQPAFFSLAGKGVLLAALIFVLHLSIRVITMLRSRQKTYDLQLLVTDMLVFLCYFLPLLTNFQAHYVLWVLPLAMVLAASVPRLWPAITLLVAVSGLLLYRNELGPQTYFLDSGAYRGQYALPLTDSVTTYLLGVGHVAALFAIGVVALISSAVKVTGSRLRELLPVLSVAGFVWILVGVPAAYALRNIGMVATARELAFVRGNELHRGYMSVGVPAQFNAQRQIVLQQDPSALRAFMGRIAAFDLDRQRNFEAVVTLQARDAVEDVVVYGDCAFTRIPEKADAQQVTYRNANYRCVEWLANLPVQQQQEMPTIEVAVRTIEQQYLIDSQLHHAVWWQAVGGMVSVLGILIGMAVLLRRYLKLSYSTAKKYEA
jgi:hypothetical protein